MHSARSTEVTSEDEMSARDKKQDEDEENMRMRAQKGNRRQVWISPKEGTYDHL